MKRKLFLIGLLIFGISALILNINIYNKDVIKNTTFLANNYSEDSKYLLIYDLNGGDKYSGFVGYTKIRDGVYGLNETGSQKLDYSSFFQKGKNMILYWSKDHLCSTKDLEIGADPKVNTHTVFYACYEQTHFDRNGIRYVLDGAHVSGDNVSFGDSVHVTSCYKYWNGSARNMGYTDYCQFDQINGKSASGVVFRNQLSLEKPKTVKKTYTAYFHEDSEGIDANGFECGDTSFYQDGVCFASGNEVKLPNTDNLKFGDKKFIGWAADDDGKNVNCSGSLVTGKSVKLTTDVKYYACYEKTESCKNTEKISNGTSTYEVKVCYEAYTKNVANELLVRPKTDEYDEILTCAKGYSLSKVSRSNIIETTCNAVGDCYKIYKLSCVGERPKVSASVGIVSGKFGDIEFSGTSSVGIKGWYSSQYFQKPTVNTQWIMDSRGKYSLPAAPGSVFLWVIDNSDQISYAVMTSVIDRVNVDTTLKTLEAKGNHGEQLNMTKYSYDYSYDMNSNDYMLLGNNSFDSKVLANNFNPFDTAYTVKTSSDKISVYATLTSNDASYVPGYEPRTVDLDYGINTILIKIKNKKGIERTYTILVTREDDRDATNYLKSLSVSEGKLKFDRYTSDYVVSVGKNKRTVNINGELASINASFVDGFGPRTIKLENESTTAAIKVRSESGSIRSYVITFIKNGEETKDSKDLRLSSLSLSKSYIAFDKNVLDYNTTVDYEIDTIDIYALAENGGNSVAIYKLNNGVTEKIESKNINLNVGNNNISIIVSSKEGKTRKYTINILRKENGLEISSNNALSLLDVNGYDIGFDPEKLDYVIKIKREKTLLISATPLSNRSEVYIRGNDNLTAFSIVKIKVVSEDGQFREYTIDIKKDTFNKKIEIIALISGVVIIVCGIIVIRIKKNRKSVNDYYA